MKFHNFLNCECFLNGVVTKKEGSYLHTVPIDCLQRTPDALHLILIYNIAYRLPNSSTPGLSTESYVYILQIMNTQYTATKRTSQNSNLAFFHSHTHTDTSRKHYHIAFTGYLHSESPSSLLRQVHKTPNLPFIIQTASPNFCSNDLTRITKHSEES